MGVSVLFTPAFSLRYWSLVHTNILNVFANNHNFFRYVDLGETPNTAGIHEVKEQTQIILPSDSSSSFKLIGAYNDLSKNINVELRSTITISYAIEYISTEMSTTDRTNEPKATNPRKELLTLQLVEIGILHTCERISKKID
jgi:hypothetical protein